MLKVVRLAIDDPPVSMAVADHPPAFCIRTGEARHDEARHLQGCVVGPDRLYLACPSPTDDPAIASTSVGMTLRAARERLDWPLATVADRLRIRLGYLEALEAGQTSLLPPAYILGFLRAYSQALDLDPEEMVHLLKAEAGELSQPVTLAFPASVPDRSMPGGAIMLLGLILTVGAFAGWHRLSGERLLPAETIAQFPQRLAPLGTGDPTQPRCGRRRRRYAFRSTGHRATR
jgi:transcriptional regulator with XRE-family HTH domain